MPNQSRDKLKTDATCLVDDSDDVQVGVIIVDYNSWSQTREAVQSALRSEHSFKWIVIVDNGGSVPEPECLALSPQLVLIRSERNRGFASGINIGLRRLRKYGATHVMLLNPDARLRAETLGSLLTVVQTQPDIAIAGPVVFFDEAEEHVEFSGAKEQWHLGRLSHQTTRPVSDQSISYQPFITGCCWLMRMDVVEKLGELPEGYFLYFEDTDYCQAARQEGYRLAVVNDAKVVHLSSQTIGKNGALFRYQLARNRIWFMRRWARSHQFATFLLFTLFVKLPGSLLLFGVRDRDWPALSGFLRGCWHGLAYPVFSPFTKFSSGTLIDERVNDEG